MHCSRGSGLPSCSRHALNSSELLCSSKVRCYQQGAWKTVRYLENNVWEELPPALFRLRCGRSS